MAPSMGRGLVAALGAVAVVAGLVTGCKVKEEAPPPPPAVAVSAPAPPEPEPVPAVNEPARPIDLVQATPDAGIDAAGLDAGDDAGPEACVNEGVVAAAALTATTIRLCLDDDDDVYPDRCVEVSRADGAPVGVETAAPRPTQPDVDHSSTSVDICPRTAACLKLKPGLDGSETVDSAVASGALAAVQVTDDDGRGRLELWDLATGRLRNQIAIPPVVALAECDHGHCEDGAFSTRKPRLLGNAVALLELTDDGRVRGALYGTDGRRRGALAASADRVREGSLVALDPRTAAMVVDAEAVNLSGSQPPMIASPGADAGLAIRTGVASQALGSGEADDDLPVVVIQDLVSGRIIKQITIAPVDGLDLEDLAVVGAGAGTVALAYAVGAVLRVELVAIRGAARSRIDIRLC